MHGLFKHCCNNTWLKGVIFGICATKMKMSFTEITQI